MSERTYTVRIKDVNGVSKVSEITFKDPDFVGAQGETGASVQRIYIDENNRLTFEKSDGTSDQVPLSAIQQNAMNIDWQNNGRVDSNIDNVQEAIDKLMSDVYYVEPRVQSVEIIDGNRGSEIVEQTTGLNSTYTKHFLQGDTLTFKSLSWSANKSCGIVLKKGSTPVTSGDELASYTYGTNQVLSANTNFVVEATDEQKTAKGTLAIKFDAAPVYFGYGSNSSTINETFIKGLSGAAAQYKKHSGNFKAENYTATTDSVSGKAIYLAIPAAWSVTEAQGNINMAQSDFAETMEKVASSVDVTIREEEGELPELTVAYKVYQIMMSAYTTNIKLTKIQ